MTVAPVEFGDFGAQWVFINGLLNGINGILGDDIQIFHFFILFMFKSIHILLFMIFIFRFFKVIMG